MYISQFRIQNFKSLKDVTFEFHEKVNIFTGTNNVGKTTVLEALALWHECYRRLLRTAERRTNEYQKGDFILGNTNPIYISYHNITSIRSPNYNDIFFNFNADPNQPIILHARLTEHPRFIDIGLALSRADGDNYKIFCWDFKKFNFALFNDKSFLNDPHHIKVLYTMPVSALMPHEERKLPGKIDYLKQSRESLQVFRNRIRQLYERRNGDFELFIQHLANILSDNTEAIEFSFPAHPFKELVNIRIGNGSFQDVSLLGSGTLQVMELLMSLFENKQLLNAILLDEPDSHLHHALQYKLLLTLESFTTNCQLFLSTHNVPLLQKAKLEWVFHLEAKATYKYRPLSEGITKGVKKGFQPTAIAPVIRGLTGATTLDFIYILEADKLLLVEGEEDALRIQKILSLRIGRTFKYAFWAAGGVDSYFVQLGAMKDIFSQLRNGSGSLWEKAVLIVDKDDMSDKQRQKLITGFTSGGLKLKTHIWESYTFECVLLSELDKLAMLLSRFIRDKEPTLVVDTIHLEQVLRNHLQDLVENDLKSHYETEKTLKEITGKLNNRRLFCTQSHLKLNVKDAFESESDLQMTLYRYYQSCLSVQEAHKICNKKHFQTVLEKTFLPYQLSFQLETDFDALFRFIDNATLFEQFKILLTF